MASGVRAKRPAEGREEGVFKGELLRLLDYNSWINLSCTRMLWISKACSVISGPLQIPPRALMRLLAQQAFTRLFAQQD
jgi:hypothetical protein